MNSAKETQVAHIVGLITNGATVRQDLLNAITFSTQTFVGGNESLIKIVGYNSPVIQGFIKDIRKQLGLGLSGEQIDS